MFTTILSGLAAERRASEGVRSGAKLNADAPANRARARMDLVHMQCRRVRESAVGDRLQHSHG